jgi:hypothetical protein
MGMNSAIAPAVQQAAQTALQNKAAQQPAQGAIGQGLAQAAQMGTQNLAGQPAVSPAAQQVAQGAAQAMMGGKGGQPPTPQQLGQGLQQQAALSNAMQSAAGSLAPARTEEYMKAYASEPQAQSNYRPSYTDPVSGRSTADSRVRPQSAKGGQPPARGLGVRSGSSFVGSRRY